MRTDHPRAALRSRSSLAAAAVLSLAACGGGDAPDAPQVAATPGVATPAPGGLAAEEMPADLSNFDVPFKVPIEGPIEFEEPAAKTIDPSFPAHDAKARPTLEGLPPDHPILGAPLVIDGEVVPFDEIRKEVCLGALGQSEIADARVKIFIAEERQRRLEAGTVGEIDEVQQEEVEGYLSEVEANIKAEFPDGGYGLEDIYAELASHDPKEKIRFQMEFARLFLPENPAHFPPITLEAILKNQGGQGVLDHYKNSYTPNEDGTPRMKEPAEMQFDQAILQQILAHLIEVASVQVDPAPGVLYRINGVDITLDEIWERVQARVTPESVLTAKQWIVNTRLLERAFREAGAWLDDEEAYIAYHAHSDPYKDSLFSMERVALLVQHFPSIERYKHYRRLIDSFKRLRNPSAEELEAFAKQRTNKIVGQVQVDVDVLLCSAFDFRLNRWPSGGWAKAEQRMKDAVRELVEEQQPWEVVMEKYSDFYEPPVPKSQQQLLDPDRPKQGRYRGLQRNTLLGMLGETDYGMFLTGTSVTDFVFFEQQVGTIGQPIRGPFGWYLPKLIQRSKPPSRIPMDQATLSDLILDDYLSTELNRFAQELIRTNEVYGLDLGAG